MSEIAEVSRLLKILVATEGFESLSNAQSFLETCSIEIHISTTEADTLAGQAALMTAIVTAKRCFLGGVKVSGALDAPLLLSLPGETIGATAVHLGARVDGSAVQLISIGTCLPSETRWCVRTWWDCWRTGIVTSRSSLACGDGSNTIAGTASGAAAVSHSFRHALGDILAGRKDEITSLWDPQNPLEVGETIFYLPKALWLIGLGNLGQAYLWALGLFPYKEPERIELVLQDFDEVKESNWGTSVLSEKTDYTKLKTRVSETWALSRGFKVRRIDRRFDTTIRRTDSEPSIALSGLDKVSQRRLLDHGGFELVMDAGLGAGVKEYHQFRINFFDHQRTLTSHFEGMDDQDVDATVREAFLQAAYSDPGDMVTLTQCGLVEIAGASAAVPFVSVFAACLAVAQLVRVSSGLAFSRSIAGSINEIANIVATSPGPQVGHPVYSEVFGEPLPS